MVHAGGVGVGGGGVAEGSGMPTTGPETGCLSLTSLMSRKGLEINGYASVNILLSACCMSR